MITTTPNKIRSCNPCERRIILKLVKKEIALLNKVRRAIKFVPDAPLKDFIGDDEVLEALDLLVRICVSVDAEGNAK